MLIGTGQDEKRMRDAQALIEALLNKATPEEKEIFQELLRDAEDLHGARMRVGELETMLRRFAGPDASVTDQDRAALFAAAVNVAVAAGTLFSFAAEVQRMERIAPHLARLVQQEAEKAQAWCAGALQEFGRAAKKCGLRPTVGVGAAADGGIIMAQG